MIEFLSQPWPWYVTGPLIGLMVPLLLLAGNKPFGISSTFQHICALSGSKLEYLNYSVKPKLYSLMLVVGVIIGSAIAVYLLAGDQQPQLSAAAVQMVQDWGLSSGNLLPDAIFHEDNMYRASNLILLITGGFLIGFGTRYAGGCTAGHSIMGLSLFAPSSLVATIGFFIGGLIVSHLVYPFIRGGAI